MGGDALEKVLIHDPDPSPLKWLVCGGRTFVKAEFLNHALSTLAYYRGFPSRVVCGGANGADTLAKEWAEDMGIEVHQYQAKWGKWGKQAGPIRNYHMLTIEKPDLIIGFPGGSGTAHMMNIARTAGKEVLEFTCP